MSTWERVFRGHLSTGASVKFNSYLLLLLCLKISTNATPALCMGTWAVPVNMLRSAYPISVLFWEQIKPRRVKILAINRTIIFFIWARWVRGRIIHLRNIFVLLNQPYYWRSESNFNFVTFQNHILYHFTRIISRTIYKNHFKIHLQE